MLKYEFKYVPIEQLSPNPLRPRLTIDRIELINLADSIRQYGIFMPLLVGQTAAGLQIIAGERRWRAAKLGGLKEVPAMIVEASSIELLILFLEENLQRQPINLIEQGTTIQRLLQKDGFTIENVCSRLKMEESKLKEILSVLELPSKVREAYLAKQFSDEEMIALTKETDPLLVMHKSNTI